jgi:hypothetical protein
MIQEEQGRRIEMVEIIFSIQLMKNKDSQIRNVDPFN